MKPPPELAGEALKKWKYQRYMRDYLACVASVDENIGRLLDWLDRNGLADNTIVIYTSDQGFFLGEHNFFDKRFMYEESLRMPFLVRWPGRIKPGSVGDAMVLNVDFAPTLLAAAGVDDAGRHAGAQLPARSRGPDAEGLADVHVLPLLPSGASQRARRTTGFGPIGTS